MEYTLSDLNFLWIDTFTKLSLNHKQNIIDLIEYSVYIYNKLQR